MSEAIAIAFQNLCSAMRNLNTTAGIAPDIRHATEEATFGLAETQPKAVSRAIMAAMEGGSSRLFRSVNWESREIHHRSMQTFLEWATDEDFAHFLSSKPLIRDCLEPLITTLQSDPLKQKLLMDYVDAVPCLQEDGTRFLVSPTSFGPFANTDNAIFRAKLIRKLTMVDPRMASGDLEAAYFFARKEVTIALVLAGAVPTSDFLEKFDEEPKHGLDISSAHSRLAIMAKYGPLEKYLLETAIF